MRKIFAAIVFCLGMTGTVCAQNSLFNEYDIVVTPRIGATYSYLNSNVDSWMFGPAAGASVTYYFSKRVAAEFDINYAWMGTKNLYVNGNMAAGPFNYDLHYINTDVVARWYPIKNLNIFTGIHVGTLVSAKQKYNGETAEVKDFMNRGHVAVPAGLAYDFGKVTLDARYYFPINKLPQKDNPNGIIHPNTRAIGAVVTLGYKIQVF